MKKNSIFLLLTIFAFTADQAPRVIKWPVLEKYMALDNNKIKIINFWATWCKPCLEELPDFERLHREYEGQGVEVLLVSLDQASLSKTKVKETLKKLNITAKAVVLDEVDFNQWINKVDTSWSGSIPATLVLANEKEQRQFYEQKLSFEELKQITTKFITPR